MTTNPLLELLTKASIRTVSARRGAVTVHFGTRDVRDLSDGQVPVLIVRCDRMPGGVEETEQVVRTARRVGPATRRAGQGSRCGATEQWVELRTPGHDWYTPTGMHLMTCRICGNICTDETATQRCPKR